MWKSGAVKRRTFTIGDSTFSVRETSTRWPHALPPCREPGVETATLRMRRIGTAGGRRGRNVCRQGSGNVTFRGSF
jgi:hypothetical protein